MTRSDVVSKIALTGLFAATLSLLSFAAAVTEVPNAPLPASVVPAKN